MCVRTHFETQKHQHVCSNSLRTAETLRYVFELTLPTAETPTCVFELTLPTAETPTCVFVLTLPTAETPTCVFVLTLPTAETPTCVFELTFRTAETSSCMFELTLPTAESSTRRLVIILSKSSPWHNCNGWLGVKHQVTYLLIQECQSIYLAFLARCGCSVKRWWRACIDANYGAHLTRNMWTLWTFALGVIGWMPWFVQHNIYFCVSLTNWVEKSSNFALNVTWRRCFGLGLCVEEQIASLIAFIF